MPTDFRERVRGAIEAGLSPDEALRALTLTPAKILGLDRVTGSVEPGKLANLVVTEGDLFASTGRIRHVFVEGTTLQHSRTRKPGTRWPGRPRRAGRCAMNYRLLQGERARRVLQWLVASARRTSRSANATILTVTKGTMQNGTVLIQNGKITAVGANVNIPAGTHVIDGTGKFVMPGIIDAHSHAALDARLNEGTESVTPEVKVEVRSDALSIYRAARGRRRPAATCCTAAPTRSAARRRIIKLRWGEPDDKTALQGCAAHREVRARRKPQAREQHPQPGRNAASR